MFKFRPVTAHHALALCLAAVTLLGAALLAWMLGQLDRLTLLTAASPEKLSVANKIVAFTRMLTWSSFAMIIVFASLAALWLRRRLTRPFEAAALLARRVADGDLSGQLTLAPGESGGLAAAMGEMHSRLADMIVQIRHGTENIAGSAGQIAAGSMSLSARTEEQAASLEETASSMGQLTAIVRQNAEHAHQASVLAIAASEVAGRGGNAVTDVVATMASINDSSSRIADIINVIDGIAFQTNILALNAAVEAARAGEQGRGFAVVAGEVRSLAQRSAAAAQEIKLLIDDSVTKAGTGTALAEHAGKTMQDVVASVRRVTDIIGEIAHASAEQTAGIEQINQAISAMDAATAQNAALVEQSAAAAVALRDAAGKLSRASAAFVLGPEHGAPRPAVQLVASQPFVRASGAADGSRPRSPEMHVVAPHAAARQRRRAASEDMDWEEF